MEFVQRSIDVVKLLPVVGSMQVPFETGPKHGAGPAQHDTLLVLVIDKVCLEACNSLHPISVIHL